MTAAGPTTAFWRRCSSCKNSIGFERIYWVCNISTCNKKRTGLVFCTVSCWDAHLSVMRHRESWSEERRSPSRTEWEREQAEEAARTGVGAGAGKPLPPGGAPAPTREPQRRIVASPAPPPGKNLEKEVLVVVSKLKAYVRARRHEHERQRRRAPLRAPAHALRRGDPARAEGGPQDPHGPGLLSSA